jgi:hypothetical protein
MTDYQIQAPTRRCAVTGRELRPGEKYYSALLDDGSAFVRRDYGPNAWAGPPAGAIGFWAGRVPADGEAARRPPIDDELLVECFQRLDGAAEPAKVHFRYVVALLLMRRKRFKFEDVHKDAAGETLTLRDTRTGDRYAVADPGLTEEAMAAVQDEVFRVLGWE